MKVKKLTLKEKRLALKKKYLKTKEARKKTPFKLDLTKALLVLAIIVIFFVFFFDPIKEKIGNTDKESIKADILSYGKLAPLVYVGLVALQIIISIVPTQVVTASGGYIFGIGWGVLLSTLGMIIGSTLAYFIGKRFGRPLLEDIFKKEALEKFDSKSEKRGLMTLLLVFLLPFTPDNAACFLAGTTKITARQLVFVATLGRLPGIVVSTMIGAGLGNTFSPAIIITISAISILTGLAYIYREKLHDWAEKFI